MSDYQVTPADRVIIANAPTEQLIEIVSVQIFPEVVAVMVEELNARYQLAEDLTVADELEGFEAELDALMRELESLDFSIEVEDFDDSDDYGWEF